MKYTVLWTDFAEGNLARLWIDSTHRAAVAAAAERIDRDLKHRPADVGESREINHRIHFEFPIAVKFRISEEDRTVFVYAVWSIDRSDR